MESEGISIADKPQDSNVIEQAEEVAKKAWENAELLPSEKIEHVALPRPDVNLQDFQLYLPKSNYGFTYRTDKSLPKGPLDITDEQREMLRMQTKNQLGFAQGNQAKAALDQYRETGSEEDKKKYEQARDNYVDRNKILVGIRNPRISGNTITFDTKPVHFQGMQVLAASENPKDMEIGAGSATSANIIFTEKDGSKRLMVSLRNSTNYTWRNNPGSGAAGYFNANFNENPTKESPTQGHRTLEPIDNNSVSKNVFKEMHEELGIEEKDVKKYTMTGFGVEKGFNQRTHHEFVFDVELKISADKARELSRAHKVENEEEFKENWVDIDFTPDAIYTLCAQTICPLAPGHYAAFIATGYRLTLAEKGQKAADEYKRKLEIGILENKERINRIVRQFLREKVSQDPEFLNKPTQDQLARFAAKEKAFLEKNPNATDEERDKFRTEFFATQPKYDPDGFNPLMLPEEQGLPGAKEAMIQSGLIKDQSKIVESAAA